MSKLMKAILTLAAFLVCIGLVVVGHRQIGPAHLGIMMIGLFGLLAMLWLYNRQFL